MGKCKELSSDLKDTIVNLALKGYSLRKIGRLIGKCHATVQYILNKFKYKGSVENVPRKPKQKKLSEKEERTIVRQVKFNPRISAPKLRSTLEVSTGKKVCTETVRKVLRRNGYHGRMTRKRPYVSKKNRVVRLQFSKEHVNKGQAFWNNVLWSDETKINLFGSDGVHRVWRKANADNDVTNTTPTVKHGGGSIMLWGCMSAKGVGNIQFIDNVMDKFVYNDILRKNVKQSAAKLDMLPTYMFQQDNDPKHTADLNKTWLIWNVPKQLKTPPQSADLNPIEHLWAFLKPRVHSRNPSSKEELKKVVTEEWCKISPQI